MSGYCGCGDGKKKKRNHKKRDIRVREKKNFSQPAVKEAFSALYFKGFILEVRAFKAIVMEQD